VQNLILTFPDDILSGKDVVETLKQLVELVEGILDAFARTFEARPAKA
jgi:hypothetical protein